MWASRRSRELSFFSQLLVEHFGALAATRGRRRSRRELEPKNLASLSCRCHPGPASHRPRQKRSAGDDCEHGRNGRGVARGKTRSHLRRLFRQGHGFARPENQLDFYGRVEEFLAKHLGGRAEPWKKITGSTAELR